MSLGLAAASAALAFAAWRWWQPQPAGPVYRRILSDVELAWKCRAGHSFNETGQLTERTCPKCDQPAFPVTTYECKQHGPFEVAVRFTVDSAGNSIVSHIRFQAGDWVPVADGLPCPRCGEPLVRKPAESLPRTKKKSGG